MIECRWRNVGWMSDPLLAADASKIFRADASNATDLVGLLGR